MWILKPVKNISAVSYLMFGLMMCQRLSLTSDKHNIFCICHAPCCQYRMGTNHHNICCMQAYPQWPGMCLSNHVCVNTQGVPTIVCWVLNEQICTYSFEDHGGGDNFQIMLAFMEVKALTLLNMAFECSHAQADNTSAGCREVLPSGIIKWSYTILFFFKKVHKPLHPVEARHAVPPLSSLLSEIPPAPVIFCILKDYHLALYIQAPHPLELRLSESENPSSSMRQRLLMPKASPASNMSYGSASKGLSCRVLRWLREMSRLQCLN